MRVLGLFTVLVMMASGASAAIVNGTSVPTAWMVNNGEGAVTATAVTSLPGFPGSWSVGGSWISVTSNGVSGRPPQSYVYTTLIDTTGFLNVSIDISVWQDDRLTAITLPGGGGVAGSSLPVLFNANGVNPVGGFTLTPLDNTAGQVLSLTVRDINDTATGLRVDINSIFAETPEVPEPGTYALVGLGLAGLALIRRRRTA